MTLYSTGTVAVEEGSVTVTGTGTEFVANVAPGDLFVALGDGIPYPIAARTETTLTLSVPYQGVDASGLTYWIAPTQGRIVALTEATTQLLNEFAAVRDNAGAGLFGDGTISAPGMRFISDPDTGLRRTGANGMALTTGGVDAVTVTASAVTAPATLLVGTTTSAGVGAARSQVGSAAYASAGILVGSATTHWSAYASSGAEVYEAISPGSVLRMGTGTADGASFTERAVLTGTDFYPGADNTMSMGTSSRRWSTIYAGTGMINTSDEIDKDWRGALTTAELAAAKRIASEIGVYRWHAAIAEKGDAARLHVGVIAQQVAAIMVDEGLDPAAYGFFCYDEWDAIPPNEAEYVTVIDTDPETGVETTREALVRPAQPGQEAGNRYGIRPDELLFFICAAQEQRLAALESALAALEA